MIKQIPLHLIFFPFPPTTLPGMRKAPLLLSRLLVTFHQQHRPRGGSGWQAVMKAAGETVLPLCHHIRPLNDSSWCQALGNTGNESHPRAPRPAGGFQKGLAKAAHQHSQLLFCHREGTQQDSDARISFRFFGFFFKNQPPHPKRRVCA